MSSKCCTCPQLPVMLFKVTIYEVLAAIGTQLPVMLLKATPFACLFSSDSVHRKPAVDPTSARSVELGGELSSSSTASTDLAVVTHDTMNPAFKDREADAVSLVVASPPLTNEDTRVDLAADSTATMDGATDNMVTDPLLSSNRAADCAIADDSEGGLVTDHASGSSNGLASSIASPELPPVVGLTRGAAASFLAAGTCSPASWDPSIISSLLQRWIFHTHTVLSGSHSAMSAREARALQKADTEARLVKLCNLFVFHQSQLSVVDHSRLEDLFRLPDWALCDPSILSGILHPPSTPGILRPSLALALSKPADDRHAARLQSELDDATASLVQPRGLITYLERTSTRRWTRIWCSRRS